MKVSNASLIALLLPAVSGRFVEPGEPDRVTLFPDGIPDQPKDTQKYHIELAPGETRWVTEDEKWELRRVSSGQRAPPVVFQMTDLTFVTSTASASLTSPTTRTLARSAPARPPRSRASSPRSRCCRRN